MAPRILSIDVETCCDADLKKTGASRYSKDPSLIVTVFAWAFDKEPVKSLVCEGVEPIELPREVLDHLNSGGMFRAWNAAFEFAILTNYFGLKIEPEQATCTMQRALHAGLPGALGDAGPALGLSITKDTTAHRLMLQMAKPRKTRSGFSYWHMDDPEKLSKLRAYCERDVESERAIADFIPELPEMERRISVLDRTANLRGLRLDRRLIDSMLYVADGVTARINGDCAELTGGAVSSPGTESARLTAWLNARGAAIAGVAKGEIGSAISRQSRNLAFFSLVHWGLTAATRRTLDVLKLRQTAAKSSTKKLQAMLACMEDDDAVRGVLAYYGASRTGRWAGRLIQPQNFPRPSIDNIPEAIDLFLEGFGPEDIELLWGPPLNAISSCLRGCIIPREGTKFIALDLSQIEARLVAYLAGQKDILEVFARGDDVYTYTAEKVGLNSRQEGKVAVLGLGYGMGANKFIETAKGYGLEYTAERAEEIVRDWRGENPDIAALWWNCDSAIKKCIRQAAASPDKKCSVRVNDFIEIDVRPARNRKPLMTIKLPSGRRLYYRDVALESKIDLAEELRRIRLAYSNGDLTRGEALDLIAEAKKGAKKQIEITYSGINQITRKWGKQRTYGGKIVENITQAVARDVMCDMLLRCADAGVGDLVLSVHDEQVLETPEETAEENFAVAKRIMSTAPEWAPGLPVACDGHVLSRYGK